jgi:hypothetical protein
MNGINPTEPGQRAKVSDVDYNEIFLKITQLRSKAEIRSVCAVLAAIDNLRGATTPAEEFILQILRLYADEGFTPDDVTKELEKFRDDFEYMKREAVDFVKRYGLLQPETTSSESH